ncbi:MAG: hypothetical protein JXC36_01160, partial [Candidatus Atribacteria bacterium]|nr:hypothetical protein [Candidatus Atribacteria bacterium]
PAVGPTAPNLPESDQSQEVPNQAKNGGGYPILILDNCHYDLIFLKNMVNEVFVICCSLVC